MRCSHGKKGKAPLVIELLSEVSQKLCATREYEFFLTKAALINEP